MRCAKCGRFTKEPHRHVTEVPFNLVTSESESRRLLGSATIPDSATIEKQLAANPVYQKALADEMALPPPTEADVVDIDELFRKLRPVRRRWPWRKRR